MDTKENDMPTMSTIKCYTFNKVVNGVTYLCRKTYVTKYEKRGRPKMTDAEKLQSMINRTNKKLENLKAVRTIHNTIDN